MIRVIILDCFGVLAESGWGLIDDTYKPTKEQWDEMSAVSHACDRGIISIAELVQAFADVLDVGPGEINQVIGSQRKNYPLLQLIEQLKDKGYTIAMLSNVGSGFMNDYFTEKELLLFDHMFLSSDLGMTKPDPEIYEHCIKALDVSANECLFIDDNATNVYAAEAEGIHGHVYNDLDTLVSRLADFDI
ncbi:MAG: HAD family phosphatase [Patescibacteria group bacterium]